LRRRHLGNRVRSRLDHGGGIRRHRHRRRHPPAEQALRNRRERSRDPGRLPVPYQVGYNGLIKEIIMAPTRIPEGFVLVKPRSVELATALLKAADEIKVDRQLSIRTVHGGYHVAQAVAEKLQECFTVAQIEADSEI